KEANANPTEGFPRHAQILDSQFVLIARILKQFYPNIRLAYWSSRIYGGYATTTLNPEPYAYESGFAVKWTITRQINGDTALRYADPQPRAPWLAWGPYLWADGLVPRSDSLIWLCDDFVPSDRTHPSTSGRMKVAQMLLRFFKNDSTTRRWFLRAGTTSVGERPLRGFALYPNFPNPFNPTTNLRFEVRGWEFISLKVYNVLGEEVAVLVDERKQPGSHVVAFDGTDLPSGLYVAVLRGGGFRASQKMLLIR
ncbi:MAG TPA: T9SS type A sorting domain-containing protein, partial [Bacteroidota bacterium]|nr:T9SS type A sorting domain-containing protein [Bacteroidota bacterium]